LNVIAVQRGELNSGAGVVHDDHSRPPANSRSFFNRTTKSSTPGNAVLE
jgi:hypothetical protein